eukprot:scaffold3118_cov60-Attheya_sp.AAC.1
MAATATRSYARGGNSVVFYSDHIQYGLIWPNGANLPDENHLLKDRVTKLWVMSLFFGPPAAPSFVLRALPSVRVTRYDARLR